MLLITMGILRVKAINSTKARVGVVRDEPKLPDDSGEVPKPNRVVDGSIPGYEIVSLLDGKLTRWSSASCVPKRTKLGGGLRLVVRSNSFLVQTNWPSSFSLDSKFDWHFAPTRSSPISVNWIVFEGPALKFIEKENPKR
jgi:hypothetical protein